MRPPLVRRYKYADRGQKQLECKSRLAKLDMLRDMAVAVGCNKTDKPPLAQAQVSQIRTRQSHTATYTLFPTPRRMLCSPAARTPMRTASGATRGGIRECPSFGPTTVFLLAAIADARSHAFCYPTFTQDSRGTLVPSELPEAEKLPRAIRSRTRAPRTQAILVRLRLG